MKTKRILLIALTIILTVALSLVVLVACDKPDDPNGTDDDKHQHTFAERWEYDDTYHWHPATCGHTSEHGNEATHKLNSDGECTVCDYAVENYSITFVVDGQTLQTVTYTDAANIKEPTVPAKTGYTGAWENYTPQLNKTQVVNAIYTAKTYTVTLDYGNATGGNEANTVTVTFDKPIGKLPSPTLTGNEFQGWYYNDQLVTYTTMWTWDDNDAIFEARFADTQGIQYLSSDGESYYVFNGKSATTNDVVILSVYKGLPVISICSRAFEDCSSLQEITIPSTVTSIGDSAFHHCTNLQTVTFEGDSQLQSIGYRAFEDCSSLQTVTFEGDSQLQSIGEYAFWGCSNLTEITIPGSIRSVDERAFWCCDNLEKIYYGGTIADWCKIGFSGYYSNPMSCADHFYMRQDGDWQEVTEIVIPEGVTEVGNYQFNGFNGTSISLPSTVTSIGEYAFCDCTNLQTVAFDDDSQLQSIGELAFRNCSNLKEITIPSNVTSIGNSAFNGCIQLTTVYWNATNCTTAGNIDSDKKNLIFENCTQLIQVIFGENVQTIPDYAFYNFYNCSSLQTVTFEEDSQLQKIGELAFADCDSLTEITIPSTVTSIGEEAFSSCDRLQMVTFDGDSQLQTIGDYAFRYCNSLTEITIPSSVTSIGSYAFSNCSNLAKVYYGGTIADWCKIAFENSSSNPMSYANHFYMQKDGVGKEVTEVEIPEGVTEIGDYQFYGFGNVTLISLPNTVTSIGKYAFNGCSNLTEITIPSSVTSIGGYAFYDCRSLHYNTADGVNYLGNGESPYLVLIGVSDKTRTSYTIRDTTKFIYDGAFSDCKSLTEITIPSTVTGIGYSAFKDCKNLQTVTFEGDSQLQSIGSFAFWFCSKLQKVTFDGNSQLQSIDDYAFEDCSNLTEITIPSSVTSIGRYAFEDCKNLQTVTFEGDSQLQKIGEHAFYDCSSLNEITIPSTVTSIGGSAFSGCSQLTTVYWNATNCIDTSSLIFGDCAQLSQVIIGENVQIISDYAFWQCSSLQTVTFEGDIQLQSIGECAFEDCSSLTEITIPASVTSIGSSAFYRCTNLQTVTFDGNSQLQRIGNYAFEGCRNLTEITIPASVTRIGYEAFSGCSGLQTVTFENLDGWKADNNSLVLADPAQNAKYLTKTYCDYTWTRSE